MQIKWRLLYITGRGSFFFVNIYQLYCKIVQKMTYTCTVSYHVKFLILEEHLAIREVLCICSSFANVLYPDSRFLESIVFISFILYKIHNLGNKFIVRSNVAPNSEVYVHTISQNDVCVCVCKSRLSKR